MEQDHWLIACTARAEFVSLSEDEVWAVVGNDSDGENPVTLEVLRLAAEFLAAFKTYVDHHGLKPRGINFPVRCPIERVAIEMTIRFVESEAGLGQRRLN